jgi:hypothetical protein
VKRIPLTQGLEALVDDEDFDHLMQWKWSASGRRDYRHPARGTADGSSVKMSVVVAERMGLDTSITVDHHNRRPLDNTRGNLRSANKSQNGANRGPNQNNTSGYKGVWLCQRTRRWKANIKVKRVTYHLGTFSTAEDAARAYNEAALKHFGEFAYVNPL